MPLYWTDPGGADSEIAEIAGSWNGWGSGMEVYQYVEYPDPTDPQTMLQEWRLILYAAPPAEGGYTPPNPAISMDPFQFTGPTDHVIQWDDVGLPESSFDVEVEVYVGGVIDAAVTVGSMPSQVRHPDDFPGASQANAEDDVYARMRYVNAVGEGAWVQTPTI